MAGASTDLTSQQVICRHCDTPNPEGSERCANCDAQFNVEPELEAAMLDDEPGLSSEPYNENEVGEHSVSEASPSLFAGSGQNPTLAKRGYAEAMRFLEHSGVPGEEIEYIVTSSQASPDSVVGCAVITSRRLLVLKMVGLNQPVIESCLWSDVHDFKMVDGPQGATLVVATAQDGQLTIEGLPRHQAQVVIGYGLMHTQKAGTKGRHLGTNGLHRTTLSGPLFRGEKEDDHKTGPLVNGSPDEIAPFLPPGMTAASAEPELPGMESSVTPLTVPAAMQTTTSGLAQLMTGPQALDALPIESLMHRTIQAAAPSPVQTGPAGAHIGGSLLQSIMRSTQVQEAGAEPEQALVEQTQEPENEPVLHEAEAHLEVEPMAAPAIEPAPEPALASDVELDYEPEPVLELAPEVSLETEPVPTQAAPPEQAYELEQEGVLPFEPPTGTTLPPAPAPISIKSILQDVDMTPAAKRGEVHTPHLATMPNQESSAQVNDTPEVEPASQLTAGIETVSTPIEASDAPLDLVLGDEDAFTTGGFATALISDRDLEDGEAAETSSPVEVEMSAEPVEERAELPVRPSRGAKRTTGIVEPLLDTEEVSNETPRLSQAPAQVEAVEASSPGEISQPHPVSEPLYVPEPTRMEQAPGGPVAQERISEPLTGSLHAAGYPENTGQITTGSLKSSHISTPLRARNNKAQENLVQKMKQLKELLEIGLITEEEFAQKKTELLSRF